MDTDEDDSAAELPRTIPAQIALRDSVTLLEAILDNMGAQVFVKDLESRPIERVLRDVADLVKPSESKAQIVSYVHPCDLQTTSGEPSAATATSSEGS